MMNHETSAVASAVLSGSAFAPKSNALSRHAATVRQRTAHSIASRSSSFTSVKQRDPESVRGFTLAELIVSMGVLALLVFLFTQLLNSAATVTMLGHKHMDADSQARQLLDRMAIDFAQMVKRPDVDYYLKSSAGRASDCGVCDVHDQDGWTGNDQAAFYSTVPGYYPTPTAIPTGTPIGASPVSLVSYRVNSDSTSSSYNKLERMGKGLAWNGVSTGLTPVVFLPQTIGGPVPGVGGNWPAAVSSSLPDSSYEVIGPQVFRFEYYYLLKGQVVNGTTYNPIFSDTPWYVGIPGHTNVSGMRDVTAIIVDIAVIEPKSRALIDNSAQVPPPNDNITVLAGTLSDYNGEAPGVLLSSWRNAIDTNTTLPRPALSGIRVYERYFYLNQ